MIIVSENRFSGKTCFYTIASCSAREEMSNADGKSYGWMPGAKMSDMIREGEMKEIETSKPKPFVQ